MAKLESVTIAGTTQYYQAMMPSNNASSNLKISFTGTTARTGAGVSTEIVRIYATENCWIRFGDSTVDAGVDDGFSFYLPKGIIEKLLIDDGQYIAVIQDTAAGSLFITPAKKSENQ